MSWAKLLVLSCDYCEDEDVQLEGRRAIKAQVLAEARERGWTIQSTGWASCPRCSAAAAAAGGTRESLSDEALALQIADARDAGLYP